MATLVQASTKFTRDGVSGAQSFTMPGNFTSGNGALLLLVVFGPTPSSVTINGTTATLVQSSAYSQGVACLYKVASLSGGSNAFSVTCGGSGDYITGAVGEFSGVDFTSELTKSAGNGSSSSPSITSASITGPGLLAAILMDEVGNSNLNVASTSGDTALWTENDSNSHQGGQGAYRNFTGTGTRTSSWTWNSSSYRALIAAWADTGGGPTNVTMSAGAGAYSLTGNAAALRVARKVASAGGSYASTGQAAGLRAARRMVASAASYALTGSSVTLTYTPVTAYDLVAGAGAFALTGAGIELRVARKLAAAAGPYTLTGGPAALRKDSSIAGGGGTYTLTGGPAALRAGRVMPASAGAFAVTGGAATLTHTRAGILSADPGAYTMIGGDAALIYTPIRRPSQGGAFAGTAGRRWYIFKGQRLLLTQDELAQLVALELDRISRQDVKVAPKGRKPHVIARQAWQEVQASIDRLQALKDPEPAPPPQVYIDDDDEEMALALLA